MPSSARMRAAYVAASSEEACQRQNLVSEIGFKRRGCTSADPTRHPASIVGSRLDRDMRGSTGCDKRGLTIVTDAKGDVDGGEDGYSPQAALSCSLQGTLSHGHTATASFKQDHIAKFLNY